MVYCRRPFDLRSPYLPRAEANTSSCSSYIASIGAVITVLTVAVDPTVQQMVTILSDQRSSPNSAYLGRTQYFLPAKHDDFSPTSEMIGSIYTGLFVNAQSENTTATSLDMNPSCPTGNCTFSPFQSLAVCSTCEDVSHSLRKTCHHDDLRPYCHFSLPNGLGMNKTLVDDWNGVLVTGGSLNQDSMRTQYSHALFNFSRIKGWYPDTALPSPKSISTNVNATQCVLYWCANTYEARVRNGGFSEDVKASWYNDKIEWQVDKGSHDSVMEFVQSSATVIISNDPMMNSKYRVSNFTSDQLTQYLASKLTSSNSIACWPPAKDSTDCRPAQKSEDLFDVLRDSKMDSLFANLAKSMTRSIRSVDPNRQIDLWRAKYFGAPDPREFEPAYGTATYTRTCISVRWWWLTFPAALILLTTTLLILTMIKTTRQDVAVWKSSPLPLLCTRLDGDTREHLRNAKGIVEMERLTQEIRARLTDDSGGGMGARLVESD